MERRKELFTHYTSDMSYNKFTASATLTAGNAHKNCEHNRAKTMTGNSVKKESTRYMGWKKAEGLTKEWVQKAKANKWNIPKIPPTTSTSPKKPGMSYPDATRSTPPTSKRMNHGHTHKNAQCNCVKNCSKGGYNWWGDDIQTCDKCHGWGTIDKQLWSEEEKDKINKQSLIHEMLDYVCHNAQKKNQPESSL